MGNSDQHWSKHWLSSLPSIPANPWTTYGLALLSTGIALRISLWLESILDRGIGGFFYIAIIVTSWYGGIKPAMVAVVLSTLTINYFFIEPIHEFAVRDGSDVIRLGIFALVAAVVSGLNSNLRDSKHRIEQLRQENLREMAQELAALYNQAPCGYHSLDAAGQFVRVNETELAMLGYKREEMLGRSFSNFLTPTSVSRFQTNFPKFKERGWIGDIQFEMICKDGTIVPVSISATAIKDADSNYLECRSVVIDIRERLQNEAEKQQVETELRQAKAELEVRVAERTADLALSQAQFAGILTIAEDAIISIDEQQQITLFNQGAEKIFGYTAQEVLGQTLDLLIPKRFTQIHHQHVQNFHHVPEQAKRMGERREIYGLRQDGSEFPCEASISKLSIGGKVIFTVFLQDVTERKHIERIKNEFVGVVSHELRTPLTSLRGSLGLLATGVYDRNPDKSKRMLQVAAESADRLYRLVSDILDLERLESGRVTLVKSACEVNTLLAKMVEAIQPLVEQHQLTLIVNSCEAQVWADIDAINQTLTNLLSNAIKFSPPGKTIWLTAQQTDAQQVLFLVKDQGRGIPADKLEAIFDKFQQVDASDSRQRGGTGLGLSICRTIVQQHQGHIWAESDVGVGSTFYFTLPLATQFSNSGGEHSGNNDEQ
jgi:PAS domain S-box-containing protein